MGRLAEIVTGLLAGLHAIVRIAGLLLLTLIAVAIIQSLTGLSWVETVFVVVAATVLVAGAARRRKAG